MEVIEQNAEGLERKFKVVVPASELDEKLVAKLEEMKGNVHLKGFRKGKAPVSFLKKMYGRGVMGEIVQEVITETSTKAFSERDLTPAQAPRPQFDGNMEEVISGKSDLEYEVLAEVLPEFEPIDVSTLSLTRLTADIPDEEINERIDTLASQNKDYEKVDDRVAEDGDLVVIDFEGKIDGEPFEGGKGENHNLILGSDAFIPGFEEQLIGTKADDEKVVKVAFPAEYRVGDLAGKDAEFDVLVHEVKVAKDIEVDDEFAKKFGVDDLAALKDAIKQRAEEEYKGATRNHLKRALLDKLDEAHDFTLPKSMVEQEFSQIWAQLQGSELDEEDKAKSEDDLKAEYRTIAERRVRLGLVLAEIGKKADVQVANDELQRAIQEQAMREAQIMQMQGQDISPQQVLQYFANNPETVAQIRAPLFEEKVVDFIFERATLTDKTVSKDELFADPDGEDAA
ncbi:MAG: trigger factor [Pseudomonadota bacterium]